MHPTDETREFFAGVWLPQRPLCAPEKDGTYQRRNRKNALSYGYIEANPLCLQSLIVTDVDTNDVRDLATLLGLPSPSWTVMHPKAGITTGHIAYALRTPVCLTDAARRRPVNLLARVETGIRDILGGDIGYSGRVMKNPICPPQGQLTLWDEEFPTYTLTQLSRALDGLGALPAWNDPDPRKSSGVGRNIDLFDRTRAWAYRAIKRYWSDGASTWDEVVEAKAQFNNLAFENEGREPLPFNEVKHLSHSIAHWTWGRFTPEKFSEVQAARNRKSVKARRQQGIARMMEAINAD